MSKKSIEYIGNMKRISIRIDNTEFKTLNKTEGQFVCWSPNPDYGKLEAYLNDGWEDSGDLITKKSPFHYSMSKNRFSLKETCYVVAFLRYNKKEDVCELNTVGERLLHIKSNEDFMEVYRLANKKMWEACKEDV